MKERVEALRYCVRSSNNVLFLPHRENNAECVEQCTLLNTQLNQVSLLNIARNTVVYRACPVTYITCVSHVSSYYCQELVLYSHKIAETRLEIKFANPSVFNKIHLYCTLYTVQYTVHGTVKSVRIIIFSVTCNYQDINQFDDVIVKFVK